MPGWKILPVVIIALLLISCGGGKAPVTPSATPTAPPAAIDASNLYTTKCVTCHGANREGISGLGLPLTPQSLAGRSDAEIRDFITNGKPGTAMVGWKDILSPAEIEELAQFIKNTSP